MNKKLLLIGVVIVAVAAGYFIIQRKTPSAVTDGPVPQTTEQVNFDRKFEGIQKQQPKEIAALPLPDKVFSRFEVLSSNKLGFLGSDQQIYVTNLADNKTESLEIPDELIDEDASFASFNDGLTEVVIGYENANKIVWMNLESKKFAIKELTEPMSAVFLKDRFYIASDKSKLIISTLTNGNLTSTKQSELKSKSSVMFGFADKPLVISDQGLYSAIDMQKLSAFKAKTYGNNQSILTLTDSNEKSIVEIYNQSFQKLGQTSHDFTVKTLAPGKSGEVFLVAAGQTNTNDKLLKMVSGKISTEIVAPDKYPDFLREIKIDKILQITDSEIIYSDQGNVFKIIL